MSQRSGRRRAATSAVPLLAVGVVIGVLAFGDLGSDDPDEPSSAPTTAPPSVEAVPVEDFCAAFERLAAVNTALIASPPTATEAEMEAVVTEITDLAPGTSMPAAARTGLVLVLDGIRGSSGDADSTEPPSGSRPGDAEAASTFSQWLDLSCRPS